jgi:hypothetical protein
MGPREERKRGLQINKNAKNTQKTKATIITVEIKWQINRKILLATGRKIQRRHEKKKKNRSWLLFAFSSLLP